MHGCLLLLLRLPLCRAGRISVPTTFPAALLPCGRRRRRRRSSATTADGSGTTTAVSLLLLLRLPLRPPGLLTTNGLSSRGHRCATAALYRRRRCGPAGSPPPRCSGLLGLPTRSSVISGPAPSGACLLLARRACCLLLLSGDKPSKPLLLLRSLAGATPPLLRLHRLLPARRYTAAAVG